MPEKLCKLFAISEKAQSERFLKNLVISAHDIACARFAAPRIGYSHEAAHFEFLPPSVKARADQIPHLLRRGTNGSPSRKDIATAIGALNAIFDQRTLGTAHRFFKGGEWHIFYMHNTDILDDQDNHWAGGPHLHFVNYLWANLDGEEVWLSLTKKGKRPSGVHVRFICEEPSHAMR